MERGAITVHSNDRVPACRGFNPTGRLVPAEGGIFLIFFLVVSAIVFTFLSFLGSFAKLQKATISFVLSI